MREYDPIFHKRIVHLFQGSKFKYEGREFVVTNQDRTNGKTQETMCVQLDNGICNWFNETIYIHNNAITVEN